MDTIREATLALVAKHGLEHVTNEMIAEMAGISLRTFFNYYAYKEEALIPPPLGFPAEAAEQFVTGKENIFDGLKKLLDQQLVEMEQSRVTIAMIMSIADAHPRLLAARERTFGQYEAEFRALLAQRLGVAPNAYEPALMAAIISAVFRVVMCRWAENEDFRIAAEFSKALTILPDLFGPQNLMISEMEHDDSTG
jgi:AcrR family transcriptional regulator